MSTASIKRGRKSSIGSQANEFGKNSVYSRKMSQQGGSSIYFQQQSFIKNQSYNFLYQQPQKPPKVVGQVRRCYKICSCMSSYLTMLLNFQEVRFYKGDNFTNPKSRIPLKHIKSISSYRKRDQYFIRIQTKANEEIDLRFSSKKTCKQWIMYFHKAMNFHDYLVEKQNYYKADSFKNFIKTLKESKNQSVINLDDSTIVKSQKLQSEIDRNIEENDTIINKKSDIVRLKDFKITHRIGKGAFSTVYKAQKDGHLYALKQMSKDELLFRNQLKYSLTELNVLKKCQKCPFIIPLHYAFQTEDYLYLALKYMPFGTLQDLLHQRIIFKYEDAFHILCQIVFVIQFLHQNNILYRDLKPQNILITAQQNIMLIDFGLSKELNQQQKFADTFVGTPLYLVPQRLQGSGKVNYKSDIYGAGCIFYQMLHGKVPYQGENLSSIIFNIKNTQVQIKKDIDSMAQAFLRETLEKNVQKRLGHMSSHPLFQGVDWKKLMNKQVKKSFNFNKDKVSDSFSIKSVNDADYTEQNYPNKKVNDWNFTIKV